MYEQLLKELDDKHANLAKALGGAKETTYSRAAAAIRDMERKLRDATGERA
jgi:hypothetical protein